MNNNKTTIEGITPLPWEIIKNEKDNFLFGNKYYEIAYIGCDKFETTQKESDANAAYIVRAANNFPKLLEALKEAEILVSEFLYDSNPLLIQIRLAIQEAEKD